MNRAPENEMDSSEDRSSDSAKLQNANGGDDSGAYLVLRSAGRWSDVFRLAPPAEAVIGRASANQIVVRSEKASRRHTKIRWIEASPPAKEGPTTASEQRSRERGFWQIEDLGSRNGTFVNSNPLQAPRRLTDGDIIEVAGFSIQFVRQIDGSTDSGPAASESSLATDDQLTMEMDPGEITDRRSHSRYLHGPPSSDTKGPATSEAARGHLLQLAFALARADTVQRTLEIALDALSENIAISAAGVYVASTKAAKKEKQNSVETLSLAATRQTGSRSYRRPPDSLVATVSAEGGEAVLARNILGDATMATENSEGEIDAESLILAPVRDRDGMLRGLLHLTTAAGSPLLQVGDLEFVLAVAEILAESLAGLLVRKRLNRTLKRTQRQLQQLQEQLSDKVRIVGGSESVRSVVEQISLAAPTSATVLIRGESGVGKELVATALHHASNRKSGPLICMNCAALSPSLLESELFGHEKGAFTGATDRKQGKFEAADGGTLMLDEIGEMDADIQAKFLRVLEGHPFERVGGHVPISVDVRVVAATNRDLRAMVAEGKFRQDLYYRLHVVEIVVPPLRQRGQDIVVLAEHFLQEFNVQMGRKIEALTDEAKKMLLAYSWPGNIRELKNVVERAVVLNTGTVIDASDLVLMPAISGGSSADPAGETGTVEMTIAELERQHIERVLRHTEGNKSRASQILGIERSTLDRKLKKFRK